MKTYEEELPMDENEIFRLLDYVQYAHPITGALAQIQAQYLEALVAHGVPRSEAVALVKSTTKSLFEAAATVGAELMRIDPNA